MNTAKKIFGAIVLGTAVVLTGCGNGQTDGNSGLQPVVIDNSDVESQGQGNQRQGNQEQNGQGQTKLTLGTCDTNWEITYAVDAYNAQSGKYYVEIVDYTKESQDYDAHERFKMDLATSKGTDIIWMEDMVADDLGYAGVLADLNTFLTPGTREKYLTNILEHAQTGNALYEIATTFTIGFLAGESGKLGMETDWTIDEMIQTFRANGKDANAFGSGWPNGALALVRNAIEDFVDWDAGKADFCNQEFYDILEFFGNTNGLVRATQESIASGGHLVAECSIGDITDIQYINWLFGNDWVVKGRPCKQKAGVTVGFWNSLAISSYSQCPEGAWDFIEYYMTLDWLEEYAALHPDALPKTYQSIYGLPLNRCVFEKMLEWSTVQQYYEDTGEPVPFYVGEGSVPNFYANSEADVERIKEIVALIDGKILSYRSYVSQIIGEEISGYQTSGLSAQQTAEKIQNRVQLYLDEKK